MLLKNEVVAGEIYVEDRREAVLIGESKDSIPGLYQLVEAPEKKMRQSFSSFGMEEYETQPVWENIETGELESWGTHMFSTIERIRKQYANIDKIKNDDDKAYIRRAMKVIKTYEAKQTTV